MDFVAVMRSEVTWTEVCGIAEDIHRNTIQPQYWLLDRYFPLFVNLIARKISKLYRNHDESCNFNWWANER